MVAGFAEKRGELVVEPKLAFGEDVPCLLASLGQAHDRIAADGDAAALLADEEDKGLGASLANADAKAGNGTIDVEFLAALRERQGGNGAVR